MKYIKEEYNAPELEGVSYKFFVFSDDEKDFYGTVRFDVAAAVVIVHPNLPEKVTKSAAKGLRKAAHELAPIICKRWDFDAVQIVTRDKKLVKFFGYGKAEKLYDLEDGYSVYEYRIF